MENYIFSILWLNKIFSNSWKSIYFLFYGNTQWLHFCNRFSGTAKYLEGFALAKTFKDDAAGMGKLSLQGWCFGGKRSEATMAPPFVKWFICVAYHPMETQNLEIYILEN